MPGRFAPSPTGDLHVGNLRTALVAWLAARAEGERFLVRVEDLDRLNSSVECERRQLADLAALGLDWDGAPVRQSDRFDRHRAAIAELSAKGLTYPCFCTRREIREANRAPHGDPSSDRYPGTCRELSDAERAERARERPAAIRLRTGGERVTVVDEVVGELTVELDDFVLQRNDGIPAYHVAVVVDDAEQGVTQVVRGDDLVTSTPRHVYLQRLLGLPTPRYAHVPLVVGPGGDRLAKRDGAVTLPELAESGVGPDDVLSALAWSLGLAGKGEAVTASALVDRFAADELARYGGDPVPLADLEAAWNARS